MTYIVLTKDMKLTITQRDTIYRGDNMSKSITFLLPAQIGELDTKATTVFLSYVRADGNPDIVILEREKEMYDHQHYKYVMPVTCKLSRYPGEVCMWLQFYAGDSSLPEIAKSSECKLRILDSKNLDDCLGDHQLTALYQLKKQVENFHGDSSNPDETPDNPDDGSDDGDVSDKLGFEAVEF